jgi:hypothetical protein
MPPKKKKRAKGRGRGQAASRAVAAPDAQRPDPNEKRRERLDAKREARERAAIAQRRRRSRERFVRWIMIAAVTVFLVWFFFLRTALPNAIAGHEIEDYKTFAAESRANQLHVEGEVTYESNPPVSGQHNAIPGACGVYSQPMPEEDFVHTLEHGAVGLLYQPDLDEEQIKQIEAIVKDQESHMFSMPYPQLEDPIVVTAWAHLMRLDDVDEAAITEFIDVFRQAGDAPESAECPLTQDDTFEDRPTPSPSRSGQPEPTPEPTGT